MSRKPFSSCTSDLIFHQRLDLDETRWFYSLQNFQIWLRKKVTIKKWPKEWVNVLFLQLLAPTIFNQLPFVWSGLNMLCVFISSFSIDTFWNFPEIQKLHTLPYVDNSTENYLEIRWKNCKRVFFRRWRMWAATFALLSPRRGRRPKACPPPPFQRFASHKTCPSAPSLSRAPTRSRRVTVTRSW